MPEITSGEFRAVAVPDKVRIWGQVRSHPVITFYFLAFAISWAGFVPALAASWGLSLFNHRFWTALLILPATGPALAAWITPRLAGDKRSALFRLREAVRWRVDGRWYLVAAFFPAVILLVANSLSRWSLPHHSPTFPPLNAPGVLIAVAIAVVANPWEEVGWRGFALTRLQVNHNASLAAFIVGVLWALWHIPLFLWPGSLMSRSPFWVWSVAVIGESFLFAWLYNSAGQSLAVVALFHVSWNTCAAAAGVDSPLVLTAVTICAVLAILLAFGTTLAGEKTSDRTKDRCASSLN